MNRHTCIIIEDEPLALERTKDFVGKIPFLHLLATFDNAIEGLGFLKNNTVDVLFLDINMDELTGIELLENSNIDSRVIFTTAYQEYALKGYELNVTDYLLKPFTFQRFLQAVTKAHDQLSLKTQSQVNTVAEPAFLAPAGRRSQSHIFVKTENRLEKIEFEDLLYIEGMRDYRRIHCLSKRIMTLQTFTELEHLIPSTVACRVHKSYMVALDKIKSIERGKINIEDKYIPISATYKEDFYKKNKFLTIE